METTKLDGPSLAFLVGGPRATTEAPGSGARLAAGNACDEIRPVLQDLDRLLARAVSAATAAYGDEAAADLYRGLYVGASEVGRLLARRPLVPPLGSPTGETASGPTLARGPRFDRLREAVGLTPFDLDALAIALAPELDLRYERLYAFLQDDVSRRRPGVDLVLNLLSPTAEAKLARRLHFAAHAPLLHHRLRAARRPPRQQLPSHRTAWRHTPAGLPGPDSKRLMHLHVVHLVDSSAAGVSPCPPPPCGSRRMNVATS